MSDGGGHFNQPQSTIEGVDLRIEDCSAGNSGGGVAAFGRFSLSSSEIIKCTAGGDGGGLAGSIQTAIDVLNSRIEDCSAGKNGGAVYAVDGSKITLSGTVSSVQYRNSRRASLLADIAREPWNSPTHVLTALRSLQAHADQCRNQV